MMLSVTALSIIGVVVYLLYSAYRPAELPELADVQEPDWATLTAPPIEETPSEPIANSIRVEVVDDLGQQVSRTLCATSSDGKTWSPLPHTTEGPFHVTKYDGFLFVSADHHLSRVVRIVSSAHEAQVVLPRRPVIEFQVDNGLGVAVTNTTIELRLKTIDFPEPGLRLPVNRDTEEALRPVTLEDRVFLELGDQQRVVFAAALPYYTYTARMKGVPFETGEVEFTARPGERLLVRIPFGKGPFIIGRVQDETGGNLKGAEVKFVKIRTRSDGLREIHQLGATKSGEDGRFLLAPQFSDDKLPNDLKFAGDAWLKVYAQDGQGNMLTAQIPVIVDKQVVDVGDISLGIGLQVSGRILLGGVPASKLRFDVWSEAGVVPAYTDEFGNFVVSGIPASDDVHFAVSAPGHEGRKVPVLEAALSGTFLEIRLEPKPRSALKIITDGEQLKTAVMRYRPEGQRYWSVADLRGTDSRALSPGTYEVFVTTEGEASQIETLTVVPGAETTFKPIMQPAVLITVSVAPEEDTAAKFVLYDSQGFALTGTITLSVGAQPYSISMPAGRTYEVRVTHPTNQRIPVAEGRPGAKLAIKLTDLTAED